MRLFSGPGILLSLFCLSIVLILTSLGLHVTLASPKLENMRKHGLDLLIRHGKPEETLPSLANAFGAHTVFAQKETCSEELSVERKVSNSLKQIAVTSSSTKQPYGSNQRRRCKFEHVWGSTFYHIHDLPFDEHNLPDVYTQFRKSVESRSNVRGCVKMPLSLGPPPQIEDWGSIPTLQQLVGDHDEKVKKGCIFLGGERVQHWAESMTTSGRRSLLKLPYPRSILKLSYPGLSSSYQS